MKKTICYNITLYHHEINIPVRRRYMQFKTIIWVVLWTLLAPMTSQAASIYATGQRLTAAVPGVHDDIRENFVYRINTTTGVATAVSPATSGLPSALGASPNGTLLGYRSGDLGVVDIATGSFSASSFGGPNATAFDIGPDGTPYAVPFNSDFSTQQLFRFEDSAGNWLPLGSESAVGDAIDQKRGTAAGTAEPFVIGLGVVGNSAYGVDLDTHSLVEINLLNGHASVIGEIGAVQSDWRSGFSGFSAMTGIDTDLDGTVDSLFGAVNFWDHDGDSSTSSFRFGGLGKFDLTTGEWDLIGFNNDIIYSGFAAAPVPLPPAAWLLISGLGILARFRRKKIL